MDLKDILSDNYFRSFLQEYDGDIQVLYPEEDHSCTHGAKTEDDLLHEAPS